MSIATMRELTHSFLLFLLEFSPWTSLAASASAGLKGLSMGCECGEGEEGRAEEGGRGEDLLLGGDAQVRIVDGYEPKRRPWMVYLQAICFGNENRFCHTVYSLMKMKITLLNFSSLQCQPDRFLRRPQQHWRVRRLGAEPPLGALRRALLLHQEPVPARRQGAHRDRLRPRRAGPDRGRDRRHGHHREVPGGALGADGDRHPPEVHAEGERPGEEDRSIRLLW